MKRLPELSGKGENLKRGLSFFLACVMLFSVMPVQAFAGSDLPVPTEEVQYSQPAAEIEESEPATEAVPTAEPTEATQVTEITEATEATLATEITEETEATEVTETTEATEATQVTEVTEVTEATQVTESTEATKAAEETEATEEPREARELTNLMGQLTLSLREWWFANRENAVSVQEKRVDFSSFRQSPDAPEQAGFTPAV